MKKRNLFYNNKFPDEKDSWLISYSDLITMLLCFFILFSSKEKNVIKTEFSSIVANLKQKIGVEKTGNMEEFINRKFQDEDVYQTLKKLETTTEAKVLNYDGTLLLEFPHGDLFPSGSPNITLNSKQELDKIANELLKYRNKIQITIIAYTDSTPVKVKESRWWNSNEELSAYRALKVQKYFYEKGFVPGDIFTSGEGIKFTKSKALDLKGQEIDNSDFSQQRTIAIKLESRGQK